MNEIERESFRDQWRAKGMVHIDTARIEMPGSHAWHLLEPVRYSESVTHAVNALTADVSA